MRRAGTRREVSERITLVHDGGSFEGWALNVSRGGVRAILEDKVELGREFDVEVGAEDSLKRRGRVVWVQEEPDGVIVGIEFLGGAPSTAPSGTHKSVPPPPPGADVEAPSGTQAKPDAPDAPDTPDGAGGD
jgi:hypothetical protein